MFYFRGFVRGGVSRRVDRHEGGERGPRTICSLTVLPSSSTVLIFCEMTEGEWGRERERRQRTPFIAPGVLTPLSRARAFFLLGTPPSCFFKDLAPFRARERRQRASHGPPHAS